MDNDINHCLQTMPNSNCRLVKGLMFYPAHPFVYDVSIFTFQIDKSTKEYQFIQEKIKQSPVMVFSKRTCSYSNMAKKVLDDVGVSYTVEELDELDNCADIQDTLQKLTGTRTVRYDTDKEKFPVGDYLLLTATLKYP